METLLSPQEEEALRTASLISYILHLIVAVSAVVPGAQMGPVLLLVALVLDMVKKSDAQGTWHVTHFRYRIRSVLWAAGLYLVTAPLWFLFVLPGWLAWLAISVWFLYRIVMGMVRLNTQQPIEL